MTKNEFLSTEIIYQPAQASSSLYQLPDFEMPVPENRGSTVRNLQAFQVKCTGVIQLEKFCSFVDKITFNFTPLGFTVCLHEMRFSLPGWNHP